MRFEDDIKAHKDEVTTVKFLNPLPLLLTADSTGVMFIWKIWPLPDGRKCLLRMENQHSMGVSVPVSAVDSYYCPEKNELLLLIGDEKGWVRPQDISHLLRLEGVEPLDFSNEPKRNACRRLPPEEHMLDRNHGDGDGMSDVGTEREDPKIDNHDIEVA